MLAVLVAVAQGESRNWAVPAVLLCVSIPQIALAPFAAPLLDRLGPRPIVVASGAAQVAALVCAAVFPELAVILCVLVFTASISALDSAGMLLLADRAPRETSSETAARAFARLDTARLLGSFIDPVLGGVALEHLSLSWVFLAEAAAVGVLALTAMFYPQVQWEAAGATATWWRRVKEAPALLFRNRVARVALTGLAAAIVFTSFFSAAQAIYGVETLDLSPIGVAVLAQAFVLGRLLGAHWAGRLTGDVAYRWLLIATLLMGVGLIVPGLIHSSVAAGIGFAVAGVANAIQVAAIRLIVVDAVPSEVRGRSLSTMGTVNQTAGVLGTAGAGLALAVLGPAGTLVVAGAGTVLAAVFGAVFGRSPQKADSPTRT